MARTAAWGQKLNIVYGWLQERITILSSYVYSVSGGSRLKAGDAPGNCQRELNDLQARLDHHIRQLEMLRSRKLPS